MTLNLQQNLLSTKDASALSGYNADYLSRLCRSGKIAGTQIGRTWLVNRESLEQFVREQEERKQQISSDLSQSREKEYQQAQKSAPARAKKAAAQDSVRSPFTSFVRTPAVAFVLSALIMTTSAYAATFGPIASVVEHAGAVASAAQQTITGTTNATAPRLRIASNVRAAATGIPVARTQNVRPTAPMIDGAAIAKQLALIDTPHARAETGGYRIIAYDAAANNAAALHASRARNERAFSRFIESDEPISTRVADAFGAVSSGTRDAYHGVLDTYAFSLTRVADASLALAANTRDTVTRSPEVSTAMLDTYSNVAYSWVDGSNTVVAYTANTEEAAGPAALALADTAQQNAHTFALAMQNVVDGQLNAAHGTASLALDVVPHATDGLVAFGDRIPRTLPENLVNTEASPEPATIVASAGTFSPFDGTAFLNQGRSLALATYTFIHGIADATRLAYANIASHFQNNTRLVRVSLPPPIALPTYSEPVIQGGEPTTPAAGIAYTGGAVTRVTNVSNYYSVNGVTKEMLDASIDAVTKSMSGNSGGGTTIINNGGGGFSGGDLTAANIHGTGNTTIDGTLTSAGEVRAPFFTATSLAATSTLPNIVSNSFSIGGDIITDFTGTGLAVVNGVLTATGSVTNSFVQGGNLFGATATLGTQDGNALSFITNNLARMTIDAGGSVTIGTTTSASLLSIGGSVRADNFNAAGTGTSSLPRLAASAFALGNDYVTGFTGNGLAIVGGVLGLNPSNNYFSTTSSDYWLSTKSGVYENPLTFSAPLSRIGNTISIAAANAITNGYLTFGDWNVFNNKISSTSLSAGTGISYNSGTGVISNTGLTSLQQSFGTVQTGAITLATTSLLVNGQTHGIAITNTGGTFTFTPTLSGTLAPAGGGTGISSIPTFGQILVGNGTNYTLTATSSLGLETALTFTSPLSRTGNAISIPAANGSTNGYLASGDFTTFNNKISSTSLSAGTGISYNSTTGVIANTGVTSVNASGGTTGLTFTGGPITTTGSLTLSGTLAQGNGGTGHTTYTAGDILYADNTGTLAVLPIGGPGLVLKVQAGLPQWGVDSTVGGGGSDGIFATSSGKIYPLDTSNVVLIGTNSTSTPNSIFEVNGQQYISLKLSIATTTAPTQLSVGGSGYFTGGLGIGILNTVAGTLRTSGDATIGANFAVTGATTLANATSSSFYATTLGINSSYFTSLLGSGLLNTGGVLTLDRSGDWTGTFGGHSSAFYLDATNLTNFGTQFYTFFNATTTNALAEGGAHLYFTDARADARINATSSIGTLTAAPNLTTVNTALTGLLKATSGVLSVATVGTDFLAPGSLSATYPIQYSANNFSLAFGTTTSNTWAGTQTFTNSPTFSTVGAGVVNATAAGKIYNTATSTPTLASEFAYTGALGQFIAGTSGVLSLATNGTALSKLVQIGANTILGNPTGAAGNVQAFATSSLGIALSDTTGTLAVTRGGTGTTTGGVTNGVEYYNGTTLTNSSNFIFNGTNAGIGSTTPGARLGITGADAAGGTGDAPLALLAQGGNGGTLGVGGDITFRTGNGGTGSGFDTSLFRGGNLNFTGGTGGSIVSSGFLQAGTGGGVVFTAGTGGNATGSNGFGGSGGGILLQAGGGGTGTTAGFSGGGGAINLIGGKTLGLGGQPSTLSVGGNGSGGGTIIFNGGAGSTTGSSNGGGFNFNGGDGNSNFATGGGSFAFVGGNSTFSGNGGGFTVLAGIASSSLADSTGGVISLTAGAASSTDSSVGGGPVTITGGSGGTGAQTNGNGGSITLNGGAAGLAGGSIGNILLATTGGFVGIGSTTPRSLLSIGNSNGINFSTATSSFSSTGGINLKSGCFAINGSCVGGNTLSFAYPLTLSGTNVSLAFGTTTANSWSALQTFNGGVSATTIITSGAITTGSQFVGLSSDGASAPSFTWAGDLTTGLYHAAANTIGFTTAGVERARIDGNGFLGIGTTTPGSLLSVAGNSYTSGFINTSGVTGGYQIGGQLFAYASSTNQSTVLGLNAGGQSATTSSGFIKTTAIGYKALSANTSGTSNTAVGRTALSANTTGSRNDAFGDQALFANISGSNNSAFGNIALDNNTTGNANSAVGNSALSNNTTGGSNSGLGDSVLALSTTGSNNSGVGAGALGSNTSGSNNSGFGSFALYSNLVGNENSGLGMNAGYLTQGSQNLFLGGQPNISGSGYISTGNNNIGIGYNTRFPSATADNQLSIGNFLFGTLPATTSASTFSLPTTGTLGVGTSSPYAKLSIQTNNGDTATTLFAIGSSTASATTTLFSISNTGVLTSNALSTSTFATGLNITAGCFAINGSCVGGNTLSFAYPLTLSGTNVSLAFGTTTANSWSALQTFNGGVSASTINTTGSITAGIQFIGLSSDGQGAPSFTWGGDLSTGLFHAAANTIGFSTSGVERARIDGNGFLGIGTSTPGSILSINNVANFTTATSTFYGTGGINLAAGCYAVNGACLNVNTIGGTLGIANGGTATTTFYNGGVVYSDGSKLTQASGSGTKIFTWDNANGRLGIGTTTPGTALSVTGTANVSGNLRVDNTFGDKLSFAGTAGLNVNLNESTAATFTNGGVYTVLIADQNVFNFGVYSTDGTNIGGLSDTGDNAGVYANGGTYGIYAPNIANKNFFGGSLSVGSTTPWAKLSASSTSAFPALAIDQHGAGASAVFLGGNVGIGTTTPGSLLSVQGIANFTTATSTFYGTGGINLAAGCFAVNGTCVGTNTGTVTSVNASGGTTGLTFSGGPVTNSGTLTLAGTLAAANGGTGSTTLSGLLKGNGTGSVLTAVAGTDYLAPSSLTATYPIVYSANNFSLAFGTTTANTWSAANNFTSTLALASSSPWAQLSINPNGITGPAFAIGSSTGTSFVVTNGGLVGIGTTSPGSLLSIGGNGTGWNFYNNATSTKSGVGGINIAQGCYAVNGNCLTLGSFGGTLGLANGGTATTTFYNGGLVFSDGSKLTQATGSGASILTWDNTNGFLGIGTTTPAWQLSISGTTGAHIKTTTNTASAFGVENSVGSTTFQINTIDGSGAIFSVATSSGATYFLVDSGGNVGIGTTSPGSLLSVQGIANFTTATSTFQSTGGINLAAGCFAVNGTCITGGGTTYTGTYPIQVTGSVISLAFGTTTANTWSAANNFTSTLALASSSPWAQLSINPNGITGPAFAIGSSTGTSFVVTNGGLVGIGTTSPTSLFGGTFASAGPIYVGGASTTATSTIQGNLSVLGTLKVGSNSTYITENGITNSGLTGSSFDINTPVGKALSVSYTGFGTTTLLGLNINGSATSTSNVGFNITSGCYAVNGTCLSTGGSFTNTLANGGTATTTFYNGGVVYSDGSKLTQATGSGNSIFTWNNTNGQLGLGTSTPWAQLSINPNGITGPAFAIGSSTATNFIVTNGGLVGVGTTSPSARFAISGANAPGGTGDAPLAFLVQGGNGGTSGIGGDITLLTGNGGAGSGFNNYRGGNLNFTGGLGGGIVSSGFQQAGTGGGVAFTAGTGGNATGSNGFGGLGGGIVIQAGGGGAGTTGSFAGGGGNVNLFGGETTSLGTTPGNLVVTGSGSNGGGFILNGGNGSGSTVSGGGSISINGGNGNSLFATGGGSFTFNGGNSTLSGNGGGFSVFGGVASSSLSDSTGGAISLIAGGASSTDSTVLGGSVTIAGGSGGTGALTNGSGGSVTLDGGAAGIAGGSVGNVLLASLRGAVGIGTTTPGSLLSIGGTGTGWNFYDNATSTKSGVGGINIKQGCFAVNGTCITGGGGTTYTGTYPVQVSGSVISLAFGTTTANSWSALQQFNGGASTTQLTTTGTTYLATAGGTVGIGSTTPFGLLSINPVAGSNGIPFVVGSSTATQFMIDSRGGTGNGLSINTTAAGSGITLAAISGAGDETLNISSKGTNPLRFNNTGTGAIQFFGTNSTWSGAGGNGNGANNGQYLFQASDQVNITAGAEFVDTKFDGVALGNRHLHANGTTAIERSTLFVPPTYGFASFSGANVLTEAATVAIDSPPTLGINGKTTTAYGLLIGSSTQGTEFNASTTNAIGLTIFAPQGAVNNYAATFIGGNVGIGTSSPGSLLSIGGIANFTTATSTFYGTGGLNITSGCYASNGICISAGTPFSNILAGGGTATTTFYNKGIVFSDGTKLTQANGSGNSIFNWDNTNGFLGIGTSTPGSLLSLQGIANFTTATTTFQSTGGINLTAGCYAMNGTCITAGTPFSNTLAGGGTATTTFYAGGVVYSDGSKLTQASGSGNSIFAWDNSNGRLGIGTSSPYAKFSIQTNNGDNATTLFAISSSTASATTTLFAVSNIGQIALNLNSGTTTLATLGGQTFIVASPSATGFGYQALAAGTGSFNTAFGDAALTTVTGSFNTGVGHNSLSQSAGSFNTAVGGGSLYNENGSNNVGVGYNAGSGSSLTTHTGGTYVGYSAGSNVQAGANYNTFLGNQAGITVSTGYGNTLIGADANTVGNLSSGGNNIGIGYNTIFPSATGNNQLNIGNFLFGTLPATTTAFTLPTSGKLGIGTSSPYAKFSIQTNNGDTTGTLFAVGSSTASATTTLFTILNTGFVGIGTSTPGSLLSIQGVANFSSATSTFSSSGGINLTSGCFAVNGTCLSTNGSFTNTLANGGTATTTFYAGGVVFSDASKLTQASGSGTNIFKWDNTNGFLGIGTTTPAWQLSISGTTGEHIKTTSNITSAFAIENSTGTTSVQFDTLDSAGLLFSVATSTGTTYFAIDAGGNTGISTTSPYAKLSIHAAAGDTNKYLFAIGSSTATATTSLFLVSNTGALNLGGYGAGTLTTDAAGNVTAASDERLKDINGTFDRGLAEIMQLSPILYHWNATSSLDRTTQYAGFSAQNVQTVIPEAVDQAPNGYLSLQDRPIIAASVNAIKELAGRTDALNISTTTLGSRVSNIESSLAAQRASGAAAAPVNATSLSANSITTNSLSINGNAFATSFIAPATPITFTIGSTTGSLPSEVLADTGTGVDLYKAATYAITGVQALQAQSDILANRLDAVALRVTMLEAIASSTPQTSGTLSFASFTDFLGQIGVIVKDGIAHFTSLAFTNLIASPAADGTSSVATSTIPMGDTQTIVVNNLAHPSSEIFVTITSPLAGSWYISQKNEGSFVINLSSPQTSVVTFDYFIVQTEKGVTQVAGAAAANPGQISVGITPTPAPSDPAASSTPPVANAPTIILNGDAAVDMAQGASWTDPGATATDAAGNDITAQVAVTGSVDMNTAGLYTINYSVVDSSGASAGVSRIVHVSAPVVTTTPPPAPADTAPATVSDAPVPTTGG